MPIRVCLAGATGWVGRPLAGAVAQAEDLILVGAVSRRQAGRTVGEALGLSGNNVVVRATVEEALVSPADVLVDYTSASSVKANVMDALERGVHVVVGSSGLDEGDFAEISARARERGLGVIAVGNFAMAAVLLQRFAVQAARHLAHWEIIDYAASTKIDSPGGMARQMAAALAAAGTPTLEVPVSDTVGLRESRGATLAGTQVHSIRLPGFIVGLEVLFGGLHQRLALRYEAGPGPEPYLPGTLLAIRQVQDQVGLVRGLDLFLDDLSGG